MSRIETESELVVESTGNEVIDLAESGTGVTRWIGRHPIGAFLIWFAVVGQGFAVASLFATQIGIDSQVFILGSTLIGMFLPAMVITRIADGPEGLRAMWGRIFKVKVHARWYVFALLVLTVPAVLIALAALGAPDPQASLVAALGAFLLQGVIVFVSNNLWEEVAVMGFLQARLQDRKGPMMAVVLTALFFTFQHITLVIASGAWVILLPFFFIASLGFRAVAGWTYNKTVASLFIVGLAHAASNGVTGGSGFGGGGTLRQLYPGEDFVTVFHLVGAIFVGIALMIVTRGRLGYRRDKAPA